MKNGAKIHLSAQEMELVTNKEWLFLKRSILGKMEAFLGQLHGKFSEMMEEEKFMFDNELKNQGGKISKGENYKGLPYMILDFPAKFSRNNIFAVRTMFWWGNFFSISLHLSGKYLLENSNSKECFSFLKDKQFYIHSGVDEWDHDLNEPGYMPVNDLAYEQFIKISKKDYFKISRKINLDQVDYNSKLFEISFRDLMNFVTISSRQYGEKDL